MLLDTVLQAPFMAGLVTLADPTNPFSFLNYLKKIGGIYKYYIRKHFFTLRAEYHKYYQWAIQNLPQRKFNDQVLGIGAYKHAYILNEIFKKEVYKTEKVIAFQTFNII